MISSEIAKASGQIQSPRLLRKAGAHKTNPQPLTSLDGVVLSGGLDQQKNLSNGGRLTTGVSSMRVMLPPGSGREQAVVNSNCNSAELKAKSGVTKYANPRPIEIHGQMWNVV